MKQNHFGTKQNSFEQKENKPFLNIYCQPCLKRGLLNLPVYVNLNEFENNRYICENCSFGQTYIIPLGKEFLSQKVSINPQHIQSQKPVLTDPINLTQSTHELPNSNHPHTTQFVKNIQINSNPQSQYSLADIGMYTENIIQEYKKSLDVIDKYQEMNKTHINKWKNKLKTQFQGVIGTFGNSSVKMFLKELKEMELILKESYQSSKQTKTKDKTQSPAVKETITLRQRQTDSLSAYKSQQEKISLYVETLKMSGIRNLSNLKSLYNCCKGFSDAVRILISLEHKQTNRRFDFITEKFKVCSIQTLYDAQMINGGYLDNKLQRPPLFDVLEQQVEKKKNQNIKVKSVRKEDLFESRKIESKVLKQSLSETIKPKPLPQQISLLSSQSQREQSVTTQNITSIQPQPSSNQNIQQINSSTRKDLSTNHKTQLQLQDDLQRVKMIKYRSKKPFESGLLNLNVMQRESANQIIRMEKHKQNNFIEGGQHNQIDLQQYNAEAEQSFETDTSNENKNCPFPSLKKYYQYQKGRNLFMSKLQLTQQNFQTFPPFEIYLSSVQSLTIKYCPPATDPWQLLKTLKNCFKKLNELIIEQPKLGTKETIILIAEYFPKLKSLIIKCKNEFDWELGKLFEKKMSQLVRFEVSDGQRN